MVDGNEEERILVICDDDVVDGDEEERIQVICDEETLIDCAAEIAKR